MPDVKHFRAALFKTRVGTVIAALIGLIAVAVSLLLFVLDLLVTPEVDALIVSFVVCGVGLTTGFFLLRNLVHRREPQSLFGASGRVSIQPVARTEIPARTGEPSRPCSKAAIVISGESEAAPRGYSERHQSISRYKTPEGGGLIGLIAMLGMAIMLMVGSNFARQFLSLAIPAGGVVALVLYCARRGNLD